MLRQSFWKMYPASTSLECFTPFNSSCKLMIQGKFHDVASGVFLSFMDNYDECWLSKLRPSDKWMDGQTDGYLMSHGEHWALPQKQEWFISTFPFFFNGIWSRDSSVSVVKMLRTLRAESQGLTPGKAGKRPDWYWNSVSFLPNTSRGFFLRGWTTNVITHLHLLPRLRMHGAIPPFRHMSWWCI